MALFTRNYSNILQENKDLLIKLLLNKLVHTIYKKYDYHPEKLNITLILVQM